MRPVEPMERGGRAILLALLALPATLAAVLAGPGAVGEAAGCAAWPQWSNEDGWHTLTAAYQDPLAPTDAVAVLRGEIKGLDLTDALAAVTVSVTDPDAGALAGSLEIMELGRVPHHASVTSVAVVWRPDEPLSPQTTYTLAARVEPAAVAPGIQSIGGNFSILTASTAAGPTAAPDVAPARYVSAPEPTGVPILCTTPATGSCAGHFSYDEFFDAYEQRPGIEVSWTQAAAPTTRYQAFRLDPVSGKGTFSSAPRVLIDAPDWFNPPQLLVTFADVLPEYCVRLVTTNLIDATEIASPPVCVTSTNPVEIPSTLEQDLQYCQDLPSESVRDLWCKSHPNEQQCGGGDAGVPGDGGETGDGAATDDGSCPNGCTGSAAQGADDEGCACATALGGGASSRDRAAWGFFALLALALWTRVRAPSARR